jgi:hypothetical protein
VLDVQLVLPPVIDARGRELMQEFARLHPEDVRAHWRVGGDDGHGLDTHASTDHTSHRAVVKTEG